MVRFVAALALPLALLSCSSSSKAVQASKPWTPYPGCSAAQCKAWYEGCSAECIDVQRLSVVECETKCRSQVPSCEAACPG